jgi:spore germination protein YaaH
MGHSQQSRQVLKDAWKATRHLDSALMREHSPSEWFHKQFPNTHLHNEAYFDSLQNIRLLRPHSRSDCKLSKEVYGFHPSWMGSAYKSYDYHLLTTLSYFSATVDPATGNFSSTGGWETSPAIDSAQKYKVKVELSIANLGSTANKTLLPNSTACSNLIEKTVALVKARNANGVNIDFESVPSANKAQFTQFVKDLSAELRQEIPGASVSICLYAVDWNKVFDIPALNEVVDRYVIMGYDYYVNGSSTAGPVSPLNSGDVWAPYNLSSSVQYYLNAGVPKDKLILAIPYYGRQWKVSGEALPSANDGFVNTVTYATYVSKSNAYGSKTWEDYSATHFWDDHTTSELQTWMEDTLSLGAKYDYIVQQDIAGAGIFALGYDNGSHHLWDLLRAKFTSCSVELDWKLRAKRDSISRATEGGGSTESDDAGGIDTLTVLLWISGVILLIVAVLLIRRWWICR